MIARTARETLVVAFEREYFALRTRDFWSAIQPGKTLSQAERARFKALGAWLSKNPPPGYPYRCKWCYLGTNDPDRDCLGCRFA